MDNNDKKGLGKSRTRKGENIAKEDGKEAGRHDTEKEGKSQRPTGESTPRDMSGVHSNAEDAKE